jgi:hypothetical protein
VELHSLPFLALFANFPHFLHNQSICQFFALQYLPVFSTIFLFSALFALSASSLHFPFYIFASFCTSNSHQFYTLFASFLHYLPLFRNFCTIYQFSALSVLFASFQHFLPAFCTSYQCSALYCTLEFLTNFCTMSHYSTIYQLSHDCEHENQQNSQKHDLRRFGNNMVFLGCRLLRTPVTQNLPTHPSNDSTHLPSHTILTVHYNHHYTPINAKLLIISINIQGKMRPV